MPWSEPGLLAACAIAALVISTAGTAWAIAYACRRGMFDQPGERRSHAAATPRGGGIGIVLALLLVLAWLGWREHAGWWPVAAGLFLVAGAGWGDDHRPLPIALRLFVHVVAGLALAWGLHPLGVIAAGTFVAGVLVGADSMSRAVGVPTYIADVIVATSLIAVLVAGLLTQYRVRWK